MCYFHCFYFDFNIYLATVAMLLALFDTAKLIQGSILTSGYSCLFNKRYLILKQEVTI